MRPLIDSYGRRVDHLRLSVTKACNLRCLYCRPAGRDESSCGHTELTDHQRLELVAFLHEHYGLSQVRLTGGEPLLHQTITPLIASLRQTAPSITIAMTTNGRLLGRFAADLRAVGLDRLNISLDTLKVGRYRSLTGGELHPVLNGIESALAEGFPPPKINVVALAGINDDELCELARWAFDYGLEIRFLEAMPIGPAADFNRAHFLSARRIKLALESEFQLTPISRLTGETATRYNAENGSSRGTLGIIAPISESFCGQCRRMRVTADGRLFPCLLDFRFVDLSPCWHADKLLAGQLSRAIHEAVGNKQKSGTLQQRTAMVTLGG